MLFRSLFYFALAYFLGLSLSTYSVFLSQLFKTESQMTVPQFDLGFFLNVATGILLGISELLPLISQVKSNGIVHFIATSLAKRPVNTNSSLASLLPESSRVSPDNNTFEITVTDSLARIEQKLDTVIQQPMSLIDYDYS